MRNIPAVIIILLFTIINFNVLSQTIDNKSYKLYSLENIESTVNIKLDDANEKITIELNPNEIFCINGFRGLDQDVNILNQKFIELRFKIRGGSGVAIRRYVLICISDSKLYKSIDVISMISSEFKETYVPSIDSLNLYNESSIYKLSFTMSQGDNQNYKLIAIQSEKVKSKHDTTQNHETQDMLQFSFDKGNKVFYNQLNSLNGSFEINTDNGNLRTKKDFNGTEYPSIKLKNEEYYFINQSWYIKDGKNHLTEFSSLCK
jgi:hypothetical protein